MLDEKGRLIKQALEGFESHEDAMAFAEYRMGQNFAAWGHDQAEAKWEKFSLPGANRYHEILLQLDDWPGNYRPRHYRTRNVLAHIRTGIRQTSEGRRVLFLDEIQSDWHADVHAEAKLDPALQDKSALSQAPFKKDWPLLCMKLMVWWAQRLGVDGLAWSTAELQAARWQGYGPPETLYCTVLPDAARTVGKTLGLPLEQTCLSVRTVGNCQGVPITRPFRTREQAECLADQPGEFEVVEVLILWLKGLEPIRAIPRYGVASSEQWFQAQSKPTESLKVSFAADRPKAVIRKQ